MWICRGVPGKGACVWYAIDFVCFGARARARVDAQARARCRIGRAELAPDPGSHTHTHASAHSPHISKRTPTSASFLSLLDPISPHSPHSNYIRPWPLAPSPPSPASATSAHLRPPVGSAVAPSLSPRPPDRVLARSLTARSVSSRLMIFFQEAVEMPRPFQEAVEMPRPLQIAFPRDHVPPPAYPRRQRRRSRRADPALDP